MKQLTLLAVAAIGLAVAGIATASPELKLDRHDISDKQCKTDSSAKQVVDVHFTLVNDYDSGFNGPPPTWANDTMNRHLRIWKEQDGSFCAVIADQGKFVTLAGPSPGATNTPIPAGIKGNIEGGYTVTAIVGTFHATYATHGNLGTFDLMCDRQQVCPGAHPSWRSYFSSLVSYNEFAQWGWIYHAGKHGTWLNQDDVDAAHSGDITA